MSQLTPPNTTLLNNPYRTVFQGGQFHLQSQRVLREGEKNKVTNTNRAYDPKMIEFKQFCVSVYADTPDMHLITEEKNCIFILPSSPCKERCKIKEVVY